MVRKSTRLAKEAKIPKSAPIRKTQDAAYKKKEAELKKCQAQLLAEKLKNQKTREKNTKAISNLLTAAKKSNEQRLENFKRIQNIQNTRDRTMTDLEAISKSTSKVINTTAEAKRQTNESRRVEVEAIESADNYRQQCLDLAKEKVKEEVRKNEGPLPWQFCTICMVPYGQEEQRTPRILMCGHTLCLECCLKMKVGEEIAVKCPFCRTITKYTESIAESSRKNLAVLEMCN